MNYDDLEIPNFLKRPRTDKQKASDKKFGEMKRSQVDKLTGNVGYEARPACLMCLGDGCDDEGHTCVTCDGTGFTEHE